MGPIRHLLAALAAFALLALAGSALGKAPAADSGPAVGASNASLLLERGVFRTLPDVPGALQTTHLRNDNRGRIVGAYADDSSGTLRLRGFLMERRRVTRLDVPGATLTLPSGSTTAARWWAAGWAGTRRSTP
jgi:hypothetical protein